MYHIIGGDQKEYGPVSADEVRTWIRERRLNASSLVRGEGATDWKPLSLFPEFSAMLASMATPVATASPVFVQAPRNNSMAVAGLTCGVIAWLTACCCYGIPFNILGAVFSSIALNQLRRDREGQGGRTMAIAGLVLSIVQIVMIIGFIVLGVAFNWQNILRDLKR